MREFFIFNCEAITVNLRKKRKVLDQLLVSWVLPMYSRVTFSHIKHSCRNLLTIHLSRTQGAPRHLNKWSEDKVPLQRDTKELTVQHSHLLRTHLVSLEGQPREVGLKKSTQNLAPAWGKGTSLGQDKERAKAELHMQGAMWERRAANSARLEQCRALMEHMTQGPTTMALSSKPAHISYSWSTCENNKSTEKDLNLIKT